MKIYLDGNPVAFPNERLEEPTFVIRKKDENGENVFSFTGELEFIETDFDYLYQKLKTDVNALSNRVVLKFEDDCCSPAGIYEFYITAESLEWCEGECRLTCQAVEKSESNDQVICLKNKMIYDNYNGFQNEQHPRMTYCNELRPNWLHHVVLILAASFSVNLFVLNIILQFLAVIITGINVVINALNGLIPGTDNDINTIDLDNNPSTNAYQEMSNWYNSLLNWIIGCGRKHPSPLVYRYAENVCGACGLAFKSSIFAPGSNYRNTVYVNAPINKGTQSTDTTTYWIDENKPLLSGKLYFDQLKTVFNADWKIKNNELIFERKDLIPKGAMWLDLTTYDVEKGEAEICWNWRKLEKFSYANLTYFKDAVNWVGAEAIDRWSDIVEWNNPYTPTQKGEYKPLIEFSACRFRDDGIDVDVLSQYKWVGTIGPQIRKYDNVIIMNSHTCYQPMLLIWNGQSREDGRVSGSDVYFGGFPGVAVNQFYNYPFWFAEGFPGNLYDQFFFIDDPRTSNFKGLEFKAEVPMTCEILAAMDIDGKVMTSEGMSRDLTEINVNFALKKIIITGLV